MTHKILKSASVLMILLMIFNIFATSVAATDIDSFALGDEIICISHRGDWHSYPENSAEAVKAAGLSAAILSITPSSSCALVNLGSLK